jgi:hypothetical protein
MLTKTITALSALLVLGTASAAFAANQDDPILRGRDEVLWRTHLTAQLPATEFSAVKRRAPAMEYSGAKRQTTGTTAVEQMWFDRAAQGGQ